MKRILATLCGLAAAAVHAQTVPPTDWAPIDAAVRAQIAAGQVPGAVLVVGDAEHVWLRRAWGRRSVAPREERLSPDTVFDLASLTKPLCTATATLQLAERGELQLDEPVARRWPAFAANGKDAITPRQLLSHSSGLRAGFTWAPGEPGSAATRKLLAERPIHAPGSTRLYSDLNFIALGLLVQHVAGEPLDRYCRGHVFAPLGMNDTGFHPRAVKLGRIAPTEPLGAGWLRGVVHDPTARRMGGVAGHAGLFGTADDLARFAQALLLRSPQAPLSQASIAALQRPAGPTTQSAWQGLGWELMPPLAAERDALPPLGGIEHTGYTGTGLWIDFVQKRFVVLLTSRLYPDGRGDARPLRRQALSLLSSLAPAVGPSQLAQYDPAFEQLLTAVRATPSAPAVRTGIDVLREQGYAALQGRRVGLITNLSAVDAHGWRTLDRLRHARGVQLVRVFTPEHGLYGDVEGRVASGTEAFSGLPLVSLYGRELRPTPVMLEGLDTLVFDIQDAGARFFTYISTLDGALRAAATAGVRVVVLDRPNPVGGDRVGGPMLDPALVSFTATAPMPVLHGMTIGEMARFLAARQREEGGPPVDLQVIAMQGWRRGMRFAQTGLDWVPPSPNLRRPSTALLYPGAAWVEGANVSVGRGTDHPFEWIGAPWISGERWAQALRELALPGVEISPVAFEPQAAPYRGRRCEGVALRITDAERFDAVLLAAAMVRTLHRLWPGTFEAGKTVGMVGSAASLEDIEGDVDLRDLSSRWAEDRAAFMRARADALLY